MEKDGIHFIITGGTIDSYYDGTKDTVVPNKSSIIPEFLKSLKLQEKLRFTKICMKDSRDLTKKDLKKILEAIKRSPYKRIIITHGTYTMSDTGRFLKANLGKTAKVVILTGSMIPLKGFSPSDAGFSIGYAIAKSECLKPGVYIAMNGRIFNPEEVMKITKEGKFTSIFSRIRIKR